MYIIAIRQNSSGNVALCEQDSAWDDDAEYWWTEGNMACDCNRAIQYDRANGVIIDDVMAYKCGDGQYSAVFAELEDGTKIILND